MSIIKTCELTLNSEAETQKLSARFAKHIKAPLIIWLQGDLGAGKTTFTRGLLNALGHQGTVKSPTYNIVESYPFQKFTLHHLDLYRFQSPDEWQDAGLDELITNDSITLIEWPQQGGEITPHSDIILEITVTPNGRHAHITAATINGQQLLAAITE